MKSKKSLSGSEIENDQLRRRLLSLEERMKALEERIAAMSEPAGSWTALEGVVDTAYIKELARLTVHGDNSALHCHNRRVQAIRDAQKGKS